MRDHYLVNRNKPWITHGSEFDIAILFAKTDTEVKHEALSALTIEREMTTLTIEKITDKLGTRCLNTGTLFFDDCVVPKENI